jgi:hypothetical protein
MNVVRRTVGQWNGWVIKMMDSSKMDGSLENGWVAGWIIAPI